MIKRVKRIGKLPKFDEQPLGIQESSRQQCPTNNHGWNTIEISRGNVNLRELVDNHAFRPQFAPREPRQEDKDMPEALREEVAKCMNVNSKVCTWKDRAFDNRRERGPEMLPPLTRQRLMDNEERISLPMLDHFDNWKN